MTKIVINVIFLILIKMTSNLAQIMQEMIYFLDKKVLIHYHFRQLGFWYI